MKEFFGFGGYTRDAEGFLSWQHLVFVGMMLTVMVVAAIVLGKANANKTSKEKNKVLIITAVLIDSAEIFKIVLLSFRGGDAIDTILHNLPLFLCSIQLIAIPLAAFSVGRMKEAAMDFVCIFGLLGAVFGTIGAGQNYNAYPVLSFDNMVSGFTHSISGFTSLYILIAKMADMKKKNIYITFTILCSFCVAAYTANVLIPYNYMFLMAGDGTPYNILYNLVNGNRILYPLSVVGLFLIYIGVFYYLFYVFSGKSKNKNR